MDFSFWIKTSDFAPQKRNTRTINARDLYTHKNLRYNTLHAAHFTKRARLREFLSKEQTQANKKEKRENAITGRVDVFFLPEDATRFFFLFFFQRKLRRIIGRAFEEQKG